MPATGRDATLPDGCTGWHDPPIAVRIWRWRTSRASGSIDRLALVISLTLAAGGGVAAAPLAAAPVAPAPVAPAPAVVTPAATAPAPAASLPRWTGGIDLYRAGVFTTQKTWLWCTAADVQIMRNIVRRQADHSRASQQRYFDYMRAHNRYHIPVSDGVDPGGWTAGLRAFVDSRYRLTASTSFDAALRSAVTNLRRTNLPVAITVSHGNHAWVLTGFTATADPAVTSRFTVTSVRVVGPLWGLQSRTFGYDMRPDTRLTPSQLKGFFTPWHYARTRMAWEGRWVSVQPIPAATATPVQAPSPGTIAGPPAASTSARPAASGSAIAAGPASEAASSTPGRWMLSSPPPGTSQASLARPMPPASRRQR